MTGTEEDALFPLEPAPTLTTPRLLLVPPTPADAPAIQRHFARWSIVRHLSIGVPWPYPPDGAEAFLRDALLPGIARGARLAWALRLREAPDETIGLIDYVARDTGYGNRGFWLAEHLHGRGLMTEAVIATQDHVLGTLGRSRIVVANAEGNTASRRVKEKTGAVFLDVVDLPHRDGAGRAERWAVTREAWVGRRG